MLSWADVRGWLFGRREPFINMDPSIVLQEVSNFMAGVRSLPDKITDSSVDMAVAFRDKMNEYAEAVSGKSSAEGDAPNTLLIHHKKQIDALRAEHRDLYDTLVQVSAKGAVASVEDAARIRVAILTDYSARKR